MERIRKNDQVIVIAGKNKGKRGKVIEVLRDKERVRIEGVAPMKRHLKPGRNRKTPQGGIIDLNGTIHVSNVMPLDPKNDRPTRIGFTMVGEKKVRVARGKKTSGATLD